MFYLIKQFILHTASSIIAFLTAAYFLDTFILSYDLRDLILLGALFALLNILIKPVLKFVFTPFIFLTFGLFIIIINAAVLSVTDWLSAAITIQDFLTLIVATLIMSITNSVMHFFIKRM